jgi:hypothetical protein
MPGKNPRVKPLTARKRLLVATIELDRAQLVDDFQTMAEEARALANQAKGISSLLSAVVALVAGFASFHRQKPAAAEKPSWLQTVLKGVGLASSLWQAFRSQNRK